MSLVDVVLRPTAVLLVGFIGAALLRRQPAALRHWTLAAAFAFAALLPVLRPALPAWTLPSLSATAQAPAVEDGAGSADTQTTFEFVLPPSAPARAAEQWLPWMWAIGATIGMLGLLFGVAWLSWQTRRAVRAGDRWDRMLEDVARELGASPHVRVLEARHPALLVTWGVFRPVILVPAGSSAWSDERLRVVLAHELAHLVRRDWLVQLLAECGRALYWFNPLFWFACARLRAEGEHAADDRVLRLGVPNTSYASHLVELARSFSVHGRTWLPAPSMARPSTLQRRVIAMLNLDINRHPLTPWRKLAVATIVAAAALPVAAASLGAGAPSGILRDPSGRVLPGATVRLSAIGGDAIHETVSDGSGAFQFPEIADGDYMFSARLPGFMSARQRVRVAASMPSLDVTLPVGTLQETITVRRAIGEADTPPSSPTTAARRPVAKPKCGTTEVGGNIKPPMKLKDVRPRYTQAVADANVEGTVLLQATIDVEGKVKNVEVVSAVNADLEESAINAVSQWEFSPTWLNCEPIEVRMFVNVSFKIDR